MNDTATALMDLLKEKLKKMDVERSAAWDENFFQEKCFNNGICPKCAGEKVLTKACWLLGCYESTCTTCGYSAKHTYVSD